MPVEPTTGEPNGLVGRIRNLSEPMQPRPTAEQPRVKPLANIRAVLFDIYGTLFISGSGDIGTHAATDSNAALAAAMHAVGLPSDRTIGSRGVELLHLSIAAAHQRRQAEGVDHPEVDIRDIWRDVLHRLLDERVLNLHEPTLRAEIDDRAQASLVELLTAEYECRVNPVWPMPHLDDLLTDLHGWVKLGDLSMGIVSNAQFITPLLFPALLRRTHTDFGFDESLCHFSYRRLEAKPSIRLYEDAAAALAERGVRPEQVVYVGNDMRNDIWPASRVGFRTALFAADQRSLRWRRDDPRLANLHPDAVLTDLMQLPTLLSGPTGK